MKAILQILIMIIIALLLAVGALGVELINKGSIFVGILFIILSVGSCMILGDSLNKV